MARWILLWCLVAGDVLAMPGTIRCLRQLYLNSFTREVYFPTATGEFLPHPIAIAGTPLRLFAGTAPETEDPFGPGLSAGGRLLGVTAGSLNPLLNLQLSGGSGEPSTVGILAVSPQGNFVVAAGGGYDAGPLLLYDVDAQRLVYSGWETQNQREEFLWALEWQVNAALAGNEFALSAFEQSLAISLRSASAQFLSLGADETNAFRYSVQQQVLERGQPLVQSFSDATTRVPVEAIDFSPDGSIFLSDTASLVTVRDVRHREVVQQIPMNPGLTRTALPARRHTRFANGGKHVLTLHRFGVLALWDVATGALSDLRQSMYDFESTLYTAKPLVMSPEGDYFAVSGMKGEVLETTIWTTQFVPEGRYTFSRVRTFQYPSRPGLRQYPRVAFARNGDYVVGELNGEISYYDVNATTNGKISSLLGGHTSPVDVLEISADAKWAASINHAEKAICLWSLRDGRSLRFKWQGGGRIVNAAFTPSGQQLFLEQREVTQNVPYLSGRPSFSTKVRAFTLELGQFAPYLQN